MNNLLLIAAIVLLLLLVVWRIYNQLVKAQNIVNEAFSGIDVQLKKRFELIPNLIEAVKGYNAHEAQTLIHIVESRNPSGKGIDEMKTNDSSITKQLRSFRINVEAYPELHANTQFLKLMDNLSTVENELAMSRRYYNGATRDLNTKMGVFPGVLFAKILGFKESEFYEIAAEQKEVPTLKMND